MSREAVDRVLVADLLERLRHDDQRLLLDVDDAARPRLLPGRTRGQVVGQRRGNRRGGGVGIGRRGGGRGFGLLVGRGRHVEQEERRDVALLALARGVELGRGRAARAQVAARHDDRVQVEVLAVEEAVDERRASTSTKRHAGCRAAASATAKGAPLNRRKPLLHGSEFASESVVGALQLCRREHAVHHSGVLDALALRGEPER